MYGYESIAYGAFKYLGYNLFVRYNSHLKIRFLYLIDSYLTILFWKRYPQKTKECSFFEKNAKLPWIGPSLFTFSNCTSRIRVCCIYVSCRLKRQLSGTCYLVIVYQKYIFYISVPVLADVAWTLSKKRKEKKKADFPWTA